MPTNPVPANPVWEAQQARNAQLLDASVCLADEVVSHELPFHIDLATTGQISEKEKYLLRAMEVAGARVALRTLASLAKINELDHLGGALDLLPALTLTLSVLDRDRMAYTFEHAHTSVGYYAALAVRGFLDEQVVVDRFRRSLDIAGHVSWVPGGTEMQGGRLGVMVPVAVGHALALKARHGAGACVFCHCGDAGWISGQALNGFNGADLHGAPVVFIMHRNGIQLSNTNRKIMDKDPRRIIAAMGIKVLEISTLLDIDQLWGAYREAYALAAEGRPSLIYPTGFRSKGQDRVTLSTFGAMYGVEAELAVFAGEHGVEMDTEIWIPGSLMSYRDRIPMFECLFHVNNLPGGAGHHDGHMKGRDLDEVLSNPMFKEPEEQKAAWAELQAKPKKEVISRARPTPGSPNLVLPGAAVAEVELPPAGKRVSARAGSQAGYAAVAKTFPKNVFVVSCDLDPSTKLDKARTFLAADHQFEMSIEEQASALMATGLAVANHEPQLNVFSTFVAFFEGIAREGLDVWRYQRNLNGINEGMNVTLHMSHVGACTGRDHFSGWGLDWINMGLCYLPYLHRFYAPADARAAFLAVKDLAAHYGGHLIGIPRDNLPILEKPDGTALWEATDDWEPVTAYRTNPGADKVILAFGAPAFLAGEAAAMLSAQGTPVDVHIVNGLPLLEGQLNGLLEKYPGGIVTIEDGIIDTRERGLQGFAGLVASAAYAKNLSLEHLGIVDPRIAPSHDHMEVWAHFGITAEALVEATLRL